MEYRVFVTGEVEHTFLVEAKDQITAMSMAEQEFFSKFTCVSGGLDVGFDNVSAWDAEEA